MTLYDVLEPIAYGMFAGLLLYVVVKAYVEMIR